MSRARARAIVFDLDGTLVDSRLDLAAAINRMRHELGLPSLASDEILQMVGAGARNLVRRALGGGPSSELLERGFAAFLRHYDAVCTQQTRPFPEVERMLRGLPENLPAAVLSNKPEAFTRRIVEHLGWRERFAVVAGGDTYRTRKPHPAGLLEIARTLACPPAELLLVGDSRIDRETAQAAGARFLFAVWGFARGEERRQLAAEETIRVAEDLMARLS